MEVYLVLWLTGFFGGVHCVGMCGGIVMMLSGSLSKQVQKNSKLLTQYHLLYNLGRISSYVTLGLIIGTIGVIFSNSGLTLVLRLISGLMMIVIGLYIANWWLGIQKLEKLGQGLWQKIQQRLQFLLPVQNKKTAFLVGTMWGGLPCGLVYSALALTASSSQSTLDGGLMMLFFALGTLPSLLLMSSISVQVSRFINLVWVRRSVAILMIGLGLQLLLSLSLNTDIPHHY